MDNQLTMSSIFGWLLLISLYIGRKSSIFRCIISSTIMTHFSILCRFLQQRFKSDVSCHPKLEWICCYPKLDVLCLPKLEWPPRPALIRFSSLGQCPGCMVRDRFGPALIWFSSLGQCPRNIQFWMTINPFQLWKTWNIQIWMAINPFQYRMTRNIRFWMTTNTFQLWMKRNIQIWMILAQIPHYIEEGIIIIQFWMIILL